MGTNETILMLAQAGVESVRGTPVAATRKVYARIAPSYDRPVATFQDTSGTFEARRRVMYGRQRVGFSATDIATYEDLAWWLGLAMRGGVSPVAGTGTPIPQTRTYTPSLSVDDLAAITLEFNEAGNPYESSQVMVNSWTLRGDTDSDDEGAWMFEAELLGRDWAPTAFTAAIPDRATEPIIARGTKLFIDPAGGTIGTTQVTGKLISWSITGNNNVHFKAFAEDELAFAANKVGRGERTFDAEFTMEFDSDAEFANLRAAAGAQRLIRLEREGTQIPTAGGTAKKRLRVDMNGYWSGISWGDREGNITATFGLQCFYDATSGYSLRAEVVNALASLA